MVDPDCVPDDADELSPFFESASALRFVR